MKTLALCDCQESNSQFFKFPYNVFGKYDLVPTTVNPEGNCSFCGYLVFYETRKVEIAVILKSLDAKVVERQARYENFREDLAAKYLGSDFESAVNVILKEKLERKRNRNSCYTANHDESKDYHYDALADAIKVKKKLKAEAALQAEKSLVSS